MQILNLHHVGTSEAWQQNSPPEDLAVWTALSMSAGLWLTEQAGTWLRAVGGLKSVSPAARGPERRTLAALAVCQDELISLIECAGHV